MFSHPNKELKLHLDNVCRLGLSIFNNRNTKWSNDNDVTKALEIILKTHDYGKATEYFQEYIVDTENEKFKKTPLVELKKHGEFSALWTYYLVLKSTTNEKIALLAYMIVRKHHGDLAEFRDDTIALSEESKNIFKKQIAVFNFEYFDLIMEKAFFLGFVDELKYGLKFKKRIKKIKESFSEEDFILCNYLFSILISADKGEAIFYDKGVNFEVLEEIKEKRTPLDKNLVDNYKKMKFTIKSEVDKFRESIYQNVENTLNNLDLNKDKVFSINVPTGTGKTLTSLNTALKLRDKLGLNNRIIYTLPFTSVIDQNFSVFEEVLGDLANDSSVLLKHHYLARKEYKTNEAEVYEYDISKYLIENWDSEIVVTTFVQMINSIFSNKNKNLKKYHNLANSIIILDEVQSIPYKYWKLVNNTLKKMSETLNCYIILVTATMPLIFDESKNEIIELATDKKDYFSYFNRIDLDVSLLKNPMNTEEFNKVIQRDLEDNPQDSFLFVLNTIKSSLRVYTFILENFPDREIIYLSTNIVPKERLERINRIKTSKNCIVISTQLVEAGVDIDLDRVYRDFGPLDSINQVCGRCNRNGLKDKKGQVKIFNLLDENNKNKPFSTYIYTDQILGDKTRKSLSEFNEIIEEKDFFNLANSYFKQLNKAKSDDISDDLIKIIRSLNYDELNVELIPNSFKTIDLFIALDDEAENLWDSYREIYSKENKRSRYEKQAQFNRIKKDFLSFVISVPEKFYKDGKEGFNLVSRDMLRQYYDLATGFKREDKQEDYFF